VPVAHTCNPSYSGGRDQEDHGSRADSLRHPIWKISNTKKVVGVEWLAWYSAFLANKRPEFKPQYHSKKEIQVLTLCVLFNNRFLKPEVTAP
jgi:hypothetical protein